MNHESNSLRNVGKNCNQSIRPDLDKYRAVAIDLDGTLLDSKFTVSEKNITALKELHAAGFMTILASARMPSSIKYAVGSLHPVTPCIAYNGALIYTYNETLTPIRISPLPRIKVEELVSIGSKYNLSACIYAIDSWWASAMTEEICSEARDSGVAPTKVGGTIPDQDCFKVMLICKEKSRTDSVARLIRESVTGVECHISDHTCIEITAAGTSKGLALAEILNESTGRLRCISFGNGANDMSMFGVSDLSIAMANAPEEVRNRADLVTASNDEDGVGRALVDLGLMI